MSAVTDMYQPTLIGASCDQRASCGKPLDVTALRQACQGSMAKALSGDLQSHTLHAILAAMHSVQAADNALDFLIDEYLETQGVSQVHRPAYEVGRLVRCAANFLFEELAITGSPHGAKSWTHSCITELIRLCALVENFGSSAQTLLALQAAVLRHQTPTRRVEGVCENMR